MNAVAVILGGGEGTRLQPLTKYRAKPAVPIAGKYRLVDIPISNCLNSHIRRMFLLTQFNSVSLHQHIQSTYHFDQFHRGYVRLLAAQQTPDNRTLWYQGTADAVRKTLPYIVNEYPDYIIILSGDQLYRMDFSEVIREHEERGADITITTKPVPRHEAGSLGILEVNEKNQITRFVEKPGDSPELDELRAPMYDDERYLASMGIYIFNRDVLQKLLDNDKSDFGHDIIPMAIEDFNVCSYIHEGYWKDIGTVRAFWEANLGLTDVVPEFTFYDAYATIYTHMRYLPPSKINCCDLNRCLLSEGCIISGHRILNSIVGIRQIIGEGTVIEHSVLMGSDFYERGNPGNGIPPVGIGRDCFIKNAIIDKNARIGNGAYITPDGKEDGTVTDLYTVREGVIVIPKNAVIPDGMRI
jgi:glucose-1-phosphate adenylyltransferase